MSPADGRGAIFVLPTTTVGQLGPVAGWISTSGWAAAAERELGRAWIVTRHGTLTVEEVRRRAAGGSPVVDRERRMRRRVPPVLKTVVKDAREAQRARGFEIGADGPWTKYAGEVAFVWQRHELWHRAGLDLARALAVPSVLFVPALLVWQAEQWGVRRPGWGRWLERHAEVPALRSATLVACGSDVIAAQAARLGVDEERLLVTPTGVDLDLFAAPVDRAEVRRSLGIGDELVVGWSGSFRPFHQLDQLVHAVAAVPGATLLLVGDGPERPRVERLAAQLGVSARFPGMVAHDRLPSLLAAMDVGVVMAPAAGSFHYSPLKVAEYLAAGLPVVAPAVPELSGRLGATQSATYYRPGDVAALTAVLRSLSADPDERARLSAGARAAAGDWSWDRQVRRVGAALAAGTE